MQMWFEGISVNYRKCLNAYFQKNNIDFDKTDEYIQEYSEEEFYAKLKEFYVITGEITPVTILSAKKNDGYEPPEDAEQKKVIKWLRFNGIKHQASGNGYKLDTANNIHYVAKLKASGMTLGYPDVIVYIGNGQTLHIEMKQTKTYKISDEQIKWINWLNDNGYPSYIAHGGDDAVKFVKQYL